MSLLSANQQFSALTWFPLVLKSPVEKSGPEKVLIFDHKGA